MIPKSGFRFSEKIMLEKFASLHPNLGDVLWLSR